jgi:hypothetical protein
LTDDAGQRADLQFIMIGHGHSNRGTTKRFLHNDMTAFTPNLPETLLRHDLASLSP